MHIAYLNIVLLHLIITAHSFVLLSAQEVFPIQYGTKFDTALQALIAGLVCKLEQLLPVPNLSQVCTFTLIAFSHLPCAVLAPFSNCSA